MVATGGRASSTWGRGATGTSSMRWTSLVTSREDMNGPINFAMHSMSARCAAWAAIAMLSCPFSVAKSLSASICLRIVTKTLSRFAPSRAASAANSMGLSEASTPVITDASSSGLMCRRCLLKDQIDSGG